MAYPTHEDVTESTTRVANTSHTVSWPTTTNNNDLLLLIGTFEVGMTVPTAAGGFTELDSDGSSGTAFVWAMIADGTESGTFTVTSASSTEAAFQIWRFSGTKGGIVLGTDLEISTHNFWGTFPWSNSVTPTWGTEDNKILTTLHSKPDGETPASIPTGFANDTTTVSGSPDPPYLVGSSTATESTVTENHSINYPTVPGGIKDGDFIIITAGADQAANPGNVYPPSGFSTLIGAAHGATQQKLYSWFKRADGTETSADTETWTTSASDPALSQTHMRIYRGVNTGADIDSWKVSSNAGGTSAAPDPNQVPNVPWYPPEGSRWIAVGVAYYNGVTVSSAPSGYANLVGAPSGGNITLMTSDFTSTAASENPGAYGINTSDDWRTHAIALAPADPTHAGVTGALDDDNSATVSPSAWSWTDGETSTEWTVAIRPGSSINMTGEVASELDTASANDLTPTGSAPIGGDIAVEVDTAFDSQLYKGTAIFAGTANEEVASHNDGVDGNFTGRVLFVRVNEGINGTNRLYFDPRLVPVGTLEFTSINGNVWTVNNSAEIVVHKTETITRKVPSARKSNVINFDEDGFNRPVTGCAIIGSGEGLEQVTAYVNASQGVVPLWENKIQRTEQDDVDELIRAGKQNLASNPDRAGQITIDIDPNIVPDVNVGDLVRLIIRDGFTNIDTIDFWVGSISVTLTKEQDTIVRMELAQ